MHRTKSSYSDHDMIELSTNYTLKKKENNKENTESTGFRSLNFCAKSVNWKNIMKMIEDIEWERVF